MKNLIMTLAITVFTVIATAAQPPQPPQGPGPGPQKMDPAKMVERMDKELSLSDVQKEQLTKIFTDQETEMKAMFEAAEEGERPSREQMEEMRKKRTEAIKAVLTDEQKAKYDEMLKKRPGPGGPGGQRPPKPEEQ